MKECKNKIMASIRGLESDITSDFLHLIQTDIAGLPPSSCIARFFIDLVWSDRTGWRHCWFRSSNEEYSRFLSRRGPFVVEFFSAAPEICMDCSDIMNCCMYACSPQDRSKLENCHYHEYSEGKSCANSQDNADGSGKVRLRQHRTKERYGSELRLCLFIGSCACADIERTKLALGFIEFGKHDSGLVSMAI